MNLDLFRIFLCVCLAELQEQLKFPAIPCLLYLPWKNRKRHRINLAREPPQSHSTELEAPFPGVFFGFGVPGCCCGRNNTGGKKK